MLRSFASSSNDPEWLVAAYSLLSQVTHATPLGYLHCMRYVDGEWMPNQLSVEVFALALDVAALGSGYLIGVMGVLFNDVSLSSQRRHRSLLEAASQVHDAARAIHGLDPPAQAPRS
jgi:hypothetical protein